MLAIMPDNIQTRLSLAYGAISYVHPEQMPNDKMISKLREIQNKLTKNHTVDSSTVTRRWHKKTCRNFADDICSLYYEYVNFEWHLFPAEIPLVPIVSEYEPEK